MIRTIIIPKKNNLTLSLPDDFLGKEIEIIAFVLNKAIPKEKKQSVFTTFQIPKELKHNYSFNREEANER